MEIRALDLRILGYAREEGTNEPVAVAELIQPTMGQEGRMFVTGEDLSQLAQIITKGMEHTRTMQELAARAPNAVDMSRDEIKEKLASGAETLADINKVLEVLQSTDLAVNTIKHPNDFASTEVDRIKELEPLPPPPPEERPDNQPTSTATPFGPNGP